MAVPISAELDGVRGGVHAYLIPYGSALKNEVRVKRKLRVQILDCRSGEPLKHVEPLKVLLAPTGATWDDAVHAAVRFERVIDWDIVENFIIPVGEDGKPQSWAGLGPSNRKKLQAALTAIGYDCGTAGAAFDKHDWAAFKRFQDDWYEAHPEETQPAKFEKKVDTKWIVRILAAYNKRFHETVQTYLASLLDLAGKDTDPQKDAGEWKSLSEQALAAWQKLDFGTKEPFTTFNLIAQGAKRKALAEKLKASRMKFFTGPDGVLHVAVPVARMREGFQIKIEFRDFAVIHETARFRAGPVTGPTGFSIEWAGTKQDRAAGPWGWRLRAPGNRHGLETLPEFQSFFAATVEPAPELSWRKLERGDLDRSKFSPFYPLGNEPDEDLPEIVLFALVWCQPVWDDVDDPALPHRANLRAYIQSPNGDRGRNMHIVTRALDMGGNYAEAGSYEHLYGGKGYGKIEHAVAASGGGYKVQGTSHATRWRSGDGHAGLDIHAQVGDKVFAVHGGISQRRGSEFGTAGWFVQLDWSRSGIGVVPGGRSTLSCLHISNYVAAHKASVKAGEILAEAGRTGNLDFTAAGNRSTDQGNPGHTHLNMGVTGYASPLRNAPTDDYNRVCIPSNDTALLFPCACEITPPGEETRVGYDPADCRFENATFTARCWAVAELVCPYMYSAGKSVFRLQAQLRYIFERNGDPLKNPGDPKGVLNQATKNAIKAFREWVELPPGVTMDDDAWEQLNQYAPVARAEFDVGRPVESDVPV